MCLVRHSLSIEDFSIKNFPLLFCFRSSAPVKRSVSNGAIFYSYTFLLEPVLRVIRPPTTISTRAKTPLQILIQISMNSLFHFLCSMGHVPSFALNAYFFGTYALSTFNIFFGARARATHFSAPTRHDDARLLEIKFQLQLKIVDATWMRTNVDNFQWRRNCQGKKKWKNEKKIIFYLFSRVRVRNSLGDWKLSG